MSNWAGVAASATLLLFMATQPAQPAKADEAFSDWATGATDDGTALYAITMNDSQLILGEYCLLKTVSCVWLVATDTACNTKHVYPALANTDKGAAPLKIICDGPFDLAGKKMFSFHFSDWSKLEGLIKKSARIGIAVPMQSDNFEVWRFSLNGMATAVGTMEAVFLAATKKSGSKPQGTFTSTL